MSIYSGFSNRKVEDKYNILLKQVITLMNQIIITMCKATDLIPFKTSFCKLQQEIKKLDTMKFSQPKFSLYLEPLAQLFAQLENGKDYRSQPQNNKERRLKVNGTQEEYNKRRNSNSDAGTGHTHGSSRNSNTSYNNSKGKRLLIGDNSLLYQTRNTISFSQHSAHNNNNTKNNTHDNNKSKSFYLHNNKNSMNRPPLVYKQNRYVQQSLIHPIGQQSHSHQVDPFRSRKIYRSRQGSHHLINTVNISNIDEKLFISSDKNNNNYINNNNNNNNSNNYSNNSNNKNISFAQQSLSMQQLMRNNPLVERKMSAQKRRKMIKWDIPQINQQQQDNQNEDIDLEDHRNQDDRIGMNLGKRQLMVKAVQQQPQSNLHVDRSIKMSKRADRNREQPQQQYTNKFQFNKKNKFYSNKTENNTPSFQDQLIYLTNQRQ